MDSSAAVNRSDDLRVRRWVRAPAAGSTLPAPTDGPHSRFARYDVKAEAPEYDDETYEKHLADPEWTKEETDYLVDVYRECNGKWPVVIDHYAYSDPSNRSMEDLKARFYTISAAILQLNTPITSMTAPEYSLYETLKNFNPKQETARKELAEGHLKRRQDEVDEESVLLSELQRIMLNQATVDNEREDLRRRLDYPHANNGYQYSTSQALTGLWQQMLHADRMRKNQRLRPTGHPLYDGMGNTPTSARPRDSNAGVADATNMSSRRATRDSLPSATPQSALPVDLSKADMIRFGVVQNQDKLPSGVTFASDKLSKPRIAKSTIQTEKIAAVLQHAGVPDLIPIPTPAIVAQFDQVMSAAHAVLDMRKLREKEEQELKVREAEAGQ